MKSIALGEHDTFVETIMKSPNHLLCALLLVATSAYAQFPDKPIKLIVPYDPGVVDAVARGIAPGMSEYLKVPVIVENAAGAAGSVGAGRVVKAAPDGYTMLYGSTAVFVQNPFFYKLPYDPVKEFAPVSYGVNTGLFLLVNKSLGVKTLDELIAMAKANPGKLTYGSSGNASSGNVAGELFKKRAGLDITHIPYKNSTVTLTDLLASRISMFFYPYQGAQQHIQAGNLIALAYTGKQRLPGAAHIPTFAESGFPGYDQTLWFSFFVPAGTPKDVIAKLNAAVHRGMKEESIKKYNDFVPMPSTPEELGETVRREIDTFRSMMKELNIKVE